MSYRGDRGGDRERRPRAPMNYRGPEDDKKVPNNPPFRAFIGNLSYDATEEHIQDFFGESAVSVDLLESGGRPRGYGFVEFDSRQALIDALGMNDEMLMNRKLRIDLAGEQQKRGESDQSYSAPRDNNRSARAPPAPKNFRGPEDMSRVSKDPPFRAFIGNLSFQATEEDVQDFFGQDAVSVQLLEDGGRPRGYGFVEFETRQALIDALGMNDEMFMSRKIRVDLAGESQQGGDSSRRGGGRGGGRGRGGGGRGGYRDDAGPYRREDKWGSDSKPSYNDRGPRKQYFD
ncbi:eukaryotic translation initiation factor 4B-like [Dreissena polymorpha]|uniref:RRM domain-containing protein n=1 Tax=Dreissena polymorpha TaxID=45954 RepID=A0A9D4GRM5_DREPO|nr:eukaryotic translation initiation factor 4B-like [Dreissena polymorpha]XP_052212596.1 eukaryotic translation initiation factor 4B-like [Dreissena polymorpha]XP_052212597.1 eukaryotic translation initiation factor 4B-like [Dreissena polymorpha]XP_052212598.1 eukaryotic translation initiation factor 4B-like [Dreissena polymorpha]KAH3822346.1 hypothetical protein DPMN_124123 [Dreissena polymorpha]